VREVEFEGRHWVWRGAGEVGGDPTMFESQIEGDGIEEPIRHQERFRSEPEIQAAMAAAGLDCLAVLGMEEVGGEVLLTDPPEDERHYKIVYIGRKAD
jgi:hypothetical protein